MSIHIGKIIKNLVKKKGIRVTEFADRINYSRRNVYEIFERESIDTGLLLKINKVLEENLFLYFIAENDILNSKNSKSTAEELREIIKDLKLEVTNLQELRLAPKKLANKKA